MFIGILLLLLGTMMMLDRLGIIHGGVGHYIPAIAIIALGIHFLTKSRKKLK